MSKAPRESLCGEKPQRVRKGRELRSELRPYTSPTLTAYGDVRSLTLGGSPGVGESGNEFTFQPLIN